MIFCKFRMKKKNLACRSWHNEYHEPFPIYKEFLHIKSVPWMLLCTVSCRHCTLGFPPQWSGWRRTDCSWAPLDLLRYWSPNSPMCSCATRCPYSYTGVCGRQTVHLIAPSAHQISSLRSNASIRMFLVVKTFILQKRFLAKSNSEADTQLYMPYIHFLTGTPMFICFINTL